MVNETTSHPTVLVGHPFAPIGMGEHLRSTFRALRSAQVDVRIVDVYGIPNPDIGLRTELEPFLTDRIGPGTAIFCINGDEIEPILAHLGDRAVGGPRIVYPLWELPRYPEEWARQLERFDEVWSTSAYTAAGIAASVNLPVRHLPLATQPRAPQPLGRRAFGIPESCYAFLTFFDFQSYIERKNPRAAVEALRLTVAARPDADLCLVVKVGGAAARPEQYEAFAEEIRPFGDRLVVLDTPMHDAQVKALHICCDAFVSLHRCEGFGLGLAEAMCFGKPVIGTGYSGNMDFMTPDTAHLVSYRLVSVPDNAYPHATGQVWAEPDVAQAAAFMVGLVDDPAAGRALGVSASRHIRQHFSYRAAGLRYAEILRNVGAFGAVSE